MLQPSLYTVLFVKTPVVEKCKHRKEKFNMANWLYNFNKLEMFNRKFTSKSDPYIFIEDNCDET